MLLYLGSCVLSECVWTDNLLLKKGKQIKDWKSIFRSNETLDVFSSVSVTLISTVESPDFDSLTFDRYQRIKISHWKNLKNIYLHIFYFEWTQISYGLLQTLYQKLNKYQNLNKTWSIYGKKY